MVTSGPPQGPGFRSSVLTAQPSGAEDLQLPKPPGFIRSYFTRHPWVLDGLIAGAYAVPSAIVALVSAVVVLVGAGPFGSGPLSDNPLLPAVLVYLAAGVSVALLFRRHVPVITAVICIAAMLVPSPHGVPLDVTPALFALYALAVYRSTRAAWIATAATVVVAAVAILLQSGDVISVIAYGILVALSAVIATLVGITFGNRRRYIEALLARAEQLARERDQRAQLAVASERARIAREMHDIVAHSLTVIVALSDGAGASLARAGDAPASATEAVRQTGITARRALTDMRRSLGVLAESAADARAGSGAGNAPGVPSGAPVPSAGSSAGPLPAALAPQPGTADLPELIATFRAAGLPVRYTTVGDAPPDPVLQLSVYRVVQEALTNALRYAQGVGRVDVDVRYDPAGISISVEDDGLDPARGAVSEGWGRGLIGLRERVQVHGGTVSAGPVGSRGWRVAVRLGAPAPAQTSVAGVSAAPTFLAPGSAVPTAAAPTAAAPTAAAPTAAPSPIDPVPEGRS